MLKWDIYSTIRILDIEHNCIPAHLAPASDNAHAAIACRHHSGQVHCPDFEIACHRNRFLYDRRVQDSRNNYLLSGF